MDKFNSELNKVKNPWIKRIGNYLLSREDLHENLKKENKSLKECFDYILIELSKKCKREGKTGYIAGDDEEIYSLAVHYYDEDDIKVGKKDFTTNADGSADAKKLNPVQKSATKETDQKVIDQAVAVALATYKREEKEKEKRKKEEAKKKREEMKAKKEAEKSARQGNNGQLDLFDLLGDENV